MGFFGRLMGIEEEQERPHRRSFDSGVLERAQPTSESQALERYRYLLRTAPPDTLEQAHAEAFAQLNREQRQQVLSGLSNASPPGERSALAAVSADDTRALARAATRAEVRQPGLMERTLGAGGAGLGASLLASFAMGLVGSMAAQSFLSTFGEDGAALESDAMVANDGGVGDEPIYEDNGDYVEDDFDV